MIAGLIARWELFIYLFGGCLSLRLSSMVPFHCFDLVPKWPSFKCFFLISYKLAAVCSRSTAILCCFAFFTHADKLDDFL